MNIEKFENLSILAPVIGKKIKYLICETHRSLMGQTDDVFSDKQSPVQIKLRIFLTELSRTFRATFLWLLIKKS